MAQTGKAAIYQGPQKGYAIEEVEVPELEPGSILVKVSMGGVCGSDLHIWRGDSPVWAGLVGRTGGHEMVGQVAALGQGVTTDSLGQPLKEGDRIAYAYFYPCLHCWSCLHGQFAACPNKTAKMSSGYTRFSGAFAEYYYLHPNHWVFKVPDELTNEVVTPVNCALSQVIFGLHQAGLRFGDTLVVQGAGGLGLNACAVAKDMGADKVIVIDAVADRLKMARDFGADETIDISQTTDMMERVGRVMELTGGKGADVVGEFVGLPSVIPEGMSMLRAGGTYLEIGNISIGNTVEIDPAALFVWGSKKMVGVIMYDPWVIPKALDFLVRSKGRYPFDRVVSHKFPLADINEAFKQAEWQNRQGDQTKISRAVVVPA
ncbi:MAG: zinc-binding dehydrogenase [Dehalococcoidia bacterium]